MRSPLAVFPRFALLASLCLSLPSLALAEDSAPSESEDGFVSIFNGEDLTGWDGDPEFWRVEDGCIVGETTDEHRTPSNTFMIWRGGTLDDFELKLKYRIVGGNSGIQYRSFELSRPWGIGGYQADIEDGDTWSGILYGEADRGIMAQRGQKVEMNNEHQPEVIEQFANSEELNEVINKQDWNEYRIIARGNHIIHEINGHKTIELIDNDETGRRMSGLLALQLHAGFTMKVEFCDIELKRLPLEDGRKKLVFIAGTPSHGYMAHEFNAGCLLLEKALAENQSDLVTAVYQNGWPQDPTAFDNADAICIFCDGGEQHPANAHLDELQALMDKGVGMACLHYGVEVPKGESGDRFVDWIGGYFETDWSVNPHWTLEQPQLAEDHPVTNGVETFAINDEWYYHMRFRDEMEGVTAVLTAVPPESTLSRPDGPHSGNPTVREEVAQGLPQAVAWAADRPDGGRGFGYTGAHFHYNWAQDDNRKLVLNALVWITGADVPAEGVESTTPTLADLEANQDEEQPGNYTDGWQGQIQTLLDDWYAE